MTSSILIFVSSFGIDSSDGIVVAAGRVNIGTSTDRRYGKVRPGRPILDGALARA
jgi:hypothetical protein